MINARNIFIFGIAFSLLFFCWGHARAFVEPEKGLFQATNVFPGDVISRTVRVENTRDAEREIGINFIEYSGDYELLGEYFKLTVEKRERGEEVLYEGDFSELFQKTQFSYFDEIPPETTHQYNFKATFTSEPEDDWQGKTFSFSIFFGLLAEGEPEEEAETVTVRGFAAAPEEPELVIFEETVITTEIGEDWVVITWVTSYPASSRVIYSAEHEPRTFDLTDDAGTPPLYGYARTTPEYNTDPRVANHAVTLTGLEPGTTYHYRTVSRASFAVSRNYSFTTLERGEVLGEEDERPPVIDWRPEDEREILGEEDITEEEAIDEEEITEEEIELFPEEELEDPEDLEEPEEPDVSRRTTYILIGIILILLIIIWLWRRDREEEKQEKLF